MITQETAERIWNAYREIAAAEKLLEDIKIEMKNLYLDKFAPHLSFGKSRNLQLGIPTGENSHRLFNVSPVLAESVIRAHMANKDAELVEANVQARIELDRL